MTGGRARRYSVPPTPSLMSVWPGLDKSRIPTYPCGRVGKACTGAMIASNFCLCHTQSQPHENSGELNLASGWVPDPRSLTVSDSGRHKSRTAVCGGTNDYEQ